MAGLFLKGGTIMANAYKVLGQSKPSATTATTLYTVPGGGVLSAVCSTLSVCNIGAAAATFRVAIRVAGATLEDKQYIVYDNYVNPYDTVFLTLGITIATTDVVTVYCSLATVIFNLFGSEVS
jgi:hypothetical protein